MQVFESGQRGHRVGYAHMSMRYLLLREKLDARGQLAGARRTVSEIPE
jgi:Ni,Fe-hydrogenase III large subunit